MPRNKEYHCGNCFFSHNPGNSTTQYWECQFEAFSATAGLPRVHKDDCVCRYWVDQESLETLPIHFPGL